MAVTEELGARGEQLAVDFLVRNGFVVLARNWRCPVGEIDIVAREAETVVVCEVKTRTSGSYGSPFEAVTPGKRQRLRLLALEWLKAWDHPYDDLRIDLVGVSCLPTGGGYAIEHLRGVA
ncbi:MAG: YraN family protein [Streptosporangiales bacterium]|nr:YraN family protein [Streptosporangiales bacterium]